MTTLQNRLLRGLIVAIGLALSAQPLLAQTMTGSVCASKFITGAQVFLGTIAAAAAVANIIAGALFAGLAAGLNISLWYWC